MMRATLISTGVIQISEEVDPVFNVVLSSVICLPSMGQLRLKSVFPHGVTMAAAVPSFTSIGHTIQERVLFFPNISIKTWPSLNQWLLLQWWAVLIGLSKCAVGQISFSWAILPVPSTHPVFIISYHPGQALSHHTWLLENFPAELRDAHSPFSLY